MSFWEAVKASVLFTLVLFAIVFGFFVWFGLMLIGLGSGNIVSNIGAWAMVFITLIFFIISVSE